MQTESKAKKNLMSSFDDTSCRDHEKNRIERKQKDINKLSEILEKRRSGARALFGHVFQHATGHSLPDPTGDGLASKIKEKQQSLDAEKDTNKHHHIQSATKNLSEDSRQKLTAKKAKKARQLSDTDSSDVQSSQQLKKKEHKKTKQQYDTDSTDSQHSLLKVKKLKKTKKKRSPIVSDTSDSDVQMKEALKEFNEKKLALEKLRRTKRRKLKVEVPLHDRENILHNFQCYDLMEKSYQNNQYNDPDKKVEAHRGDIYIYNVADKMMIEKLDGMNWKNDGCHPLSTKLTPGGRPFERAIYKFKDAPDFKKTITVDRERDVVLVHYRKPLHEKRGKSTTQQYRQQIRQELSGSDSEFEMVTQSLKTQESYQAKIAIDTNAISSYTREDLLPTPEIHALMDDAKERNQLNLTNKTTIRNPRGSDVYVFDASKTEKKSLALLRDDAIRWKLRRTVEMDKLTRQHFYHRKTDDTLVPEFKKYMYYRKKDNLALVHYLGDETLVQQRYNRKTGRQIVGSQKLVEQRIRNMDPDSNIPPSQLYQNLMNELKTEGLGNLASAPTNVRQVRYIQQKMRQEVEIGVGETANVKRLQQLLGDSYIVQHFGLPSNAYVLANNESTENLKNLMRTTNDDVKLVLHMDQTFNFGKYYLTPLLMRHPQLERIESSDKNINKEPIVPLITLMHQKKSKQDIENYMVSVKQYMEQNCPQFLERDKILVTDREFKESYLPNTQRAFCWNHIQQNIKFQVTLIEKLKQIETFCIVISH